MSSVLEGPQIALRASTPSGPLGMTGPTKQPRGNQATYLFFPVLISLVLTIIGTLSASIIPGVSTVEVYSKYGEGVVKLGAWGICIEQFPHYAGKCIPYAIFGNNTQALADLPASISKMGIDPSPVTDAYKIANGIMHATACFVATLAMFMTLAASGEHYNAGEHAKSWTRWAWWSNTATLVSGIVPLGLDIALIAHTADVAVLGDGSPAKVVPGTSMYLMVTAVLLNLGTLFARCFFARYPPTATNASGAAEDVSPPAYHVGDDKLWPDSPAKGDEDHAELAQLPSLAYLPTSPRPKAGENDRSGTPGDISGTWHELNLHSAALPAEAEWTRADDAVAVISEKRASMAKDGYAV